MNYDAFIKLINNRKSCRNYLTKDVDNDLIEKCLEAARLAPSACNKQPWRFIVVKEKTLISDIADKGLLPGVPMPWVKSAPVIICLCLEKNIITHKLAPIVSKVDYSLIDAGIAGEHFVLAAESLGLGSCWIGWFKEKNVKKLLNIPFSIKVVSLMTLGYPDIDLEPSKEKKSIKEICFFNGWEHRE